MKKINASLVVAAAAIIGLTACDNKPKFKTVDGLEYMIVRDSAGDKKPKEGDMLELHLRMSIDDSLITDTRKEMGKAVPAQLQETFKGDFWTGVKMMTPGDSAVFIVSVDSIVKFIGTRMPPGQPAEVPPLLKGKKKVKYEVVLVSVKTKEETQAEQMAASAPQLAEDDKKLQEYFAANNIQATKTASGLYYKINQEGTGDNIKAGQTAEMRYIGKTLDGKTFDANMGPDGKGADGKEKAVLPVMVGQGQVIKGWDEGLQLLKKGSKATFYIPSPLAYGPNSPSPAIPANGVLMFEVEVVDVK